MPRDLPSLNSEDCLVWYNAKACSLLVYMVVDLIPGRVKPKN